MAILKFYFVNYTLQYKEFCMENAILCCMILLFIVFLYCKVDSWCVRP